MKSWIGICIDKNKRGFGKLVERSIEAFSGSGYHCFLMLDENTGIEAHAGKGVYTFDIEKYRKGSEVVVLYKPPIADSQTDIVCERAKACIGQKYGLKQIWGFALFGAGSGNEKNKKVCSTLIGNAFEGVGIQFRGLRKDEPKPSDIKIHCDAMQWDYEYLKLT